MIALALAILGVAAAASLAAVAAVDLGWQPPRPVERLLSLEWL